MTSLTSLKAYGGVKRPYIALRKTSFDDVWSFMTLESPYGRLYRDAGDMNMMHWQSWIAITGSSDWDLG